MTRRWPWIALVAVLVLLGVAVVGWRSNGAPGRGLAGEATVTASSTAFGSSAHDVVTAGSATSPGAGWESAGETVGAWITLSWNRPHPLRRVVLVRNPLDQPGATGGVLSFGDGSAIQLRLSSTSRQTVVPFAARLVDRLRFTVSDVSVGARNVTLAEIVVSTDQAGDDVVTGDTPDGDAARTATLTQSEGGSDPQALRDGAPGPPPGVGGTWTTRAPEQAWVELTWPRPRELTSVELVGATGAASSVKAATVTFGDGSGLPIGAVLPDAEHPTIVAFMPRVTTSVRVTMDHAGGAAAIALAELRVYEQGALPARPAPLTPVPAPSEPPADIACPAPDAGPPGSGPVVRCPITGSAVDGIVPFTVSSLAGYSSVTATVWPADAAAPAGAPVRAVPDPSGSAALAVDVRAAPVGPLTVEFRAEGRGRPSSTVYFQLYRRTGTAATGVAEVPSAAQAAGRTLVYADEFDQPVTMSRTGVSPTGAGTDYAAGKPTSAGAEDFGDAPFEDGATVQVVDNDYLRIGVEPGTVSTHVGGSMASARYGGSGFSAQYGYFEARLLAPAAPGTWPAFWMMPSDNLVAPTPMVAEIDAVEMYGHNPMGACQSTHGYTISADGKQKDAGVADCGQRFASERAALSWHTYGVSITPTDITFYVDGRLVSTAPQVGGGGAPMFFLVDLALGGGWPVDLRRVQERAVLYVDHIRVYV